MDFQLNFVGGQKLEIQYYVFENVKGLKKYGISCSIIRRLFEAPQKTRDNSIKYKAYVNARVDVKSNQFREYHPYVHLFARNKQLRQLAELFSEITILFSIDDMTKNKVGAPVVSRYHHLRRLCTANNMPNFPDHGFLIPKCFIIISGYMRLENLDTVLNESNETETNSVDYVEVISIKSYARKKKVIKHKKLLMLYITASFRQIVCP